MPITVRTEGDFISVGRSKITTDDFIGNVYNMEFVVKPEKLHAGRNQGKILLVTPYEILKYDVDSEAIYGEVLEKIVIFKDRRLEVSLKDIPLEVQLRYKTSGKLDSYRVDFYDIKILE